MSLSSRRAWIEIVPKMSFYENNRVALLAEGVDRNPEEEQEETEVTKSLSSRRAWIEIHAAVRIDGLLRVALLAEGVDRNAWLK